MLLRWVAPWGVVAAVSLAPACTLARGAGHASNTAPLADCDAAATATILAPEAASSVHDARGVWTGASQLVWTGAGGASGENGANNPIHANGANGTAARSWRLAWSASAQLRATPGERLSGVDGSITLSPRAAISADLPPAFRWLPAGVRLDVAPADRARAAASWRAQSMLVQLDADGRVLAATGVQLAGALDEAYAPAQALEDLGAHPAPHATRFALWAPTAQAVAVCRYPGPEAPAVERVPMHRDDATGAWRATLPRNLTGSSYTYLVDVVVPGVGRVRNRVTDPYAISLSTDSRRAWIGDLSARDPRTTPPGWATDRAPDTVHAPTDLAVYELHVRDFSAGDTTVPAPHRGKYLAFTHGQSAGMRHLRALAQAGITDVHLLPVFDFATVPEAGCTTPPMVGPPDGAQQQAAAVAHAADDCFNWGYDPFHYDAPEGSYATDARDGAVRIREFRAMVQGLHRAGLRVGMDVVFNHTSATGQDPKSVLDRIVPGYYQRLDAAGQVEHSTCCANTATEHRMMGKLLVDSVAQWARDYHVDSFRFDLMGHQPRAVMEALQQRLAQATHRQVPLIGEGWNFGEVADGARFVQASQRSLNGTGIGTFSDRGRDALRGGSATDQSHPARDQGWLSGLFYAPNAEGADATREQLLDAADGVRTGLAGTLADYPLPTWRGPVKPLSQVDYHGQPAGYASQPAEVVNYVENHDNATLYDNHVWKLPRGTPTAERARVQALGLAVVAFSQGVAYFHAGGEMLRSKSLDRNSYDSGDNFNRLDWSMQDNGFGHGLPPKPDNGALWPQMQPLLADPALRPAPADIAWTSAAFLDLLRIRASTSLFHLATADAVRARLTFPGAGPGQEPTLVAGRLDGRGLPGARYGTLLYAVNVDTRAHVLDLPADKGRGWTLHPVHLAPGAADTRAAHEATVDDATGRFTVPPRTAVVFVAP